MVRLARLCSLALALLLAPAAARAFPTGPTLLSGYVITLPHGEGEVHFGALTGPTGRVGWEVGDFWTSEFSVQITHATGAVTGSLTESDVALTSVAGGYQLTLDILKKSSFASPYVGAGVLVGDMNLNLNTQALGTSQVSTGNLLYVELHAVAGLRVNFPFGLGLRAELAFSTYGGFFAFQPSAGLAYSF